MFDELGAVVVADFLDDGRDQCIGGHCCSRLAGLPGPFVRVKSPEMSSGHLVIKTIVGEVIRAEEYRVRPMRHDFCQRVPLILEVERGGSLRRFPPPSAAQLHWRR